jgi:hypothetical protein
MVALVVNNIINPKKINMKKVLFITNALLLGIILFMSCNKTEIGGISNLSQGATLNQLSGPLIEYEGFPTCNPCANNSGIQFDGIDAHLAKSLFARYKEENQPLLSEKLGGEDANRLWFSLESLKKFISEIEAEVYNRRSAKGLKLGIRIYYGKYPTSMDIDDGLRTLPDNYALHHTLFMVPTYEDTANGGTQWDFDPWHWGNNPNPYEPTTLADLFKDPKFPSRRSCFFSIAEKQYYKDNSCTIREWFRTSPAGFLNRDGLIMNHGDINPPPPGGTRGSGFIQD